MPATLVRTRHTVGDESIVTVDLVTADHERLTELFEGIEWRGRPSAG